MNVQAQTLLFEKDKFSRVEVMKWLKDRGISTSGVGQDGEHYVVTHSPIEAAVSPEVIAKALYPGVDPVKLRAKLIEDNDGFIGGTIRYGDGSGGSEFGTEYTDEGVKRNVKNGPSERFSFGDLTFDVDAAKEMCGGQPNDEVEVSDVWSYKINVDKVAAMRSNSDKPVIVAQIPTSDGLIPLLIDGHHRMYRARSMGLDLVDAYVMTPEESLFIVDTHPDMMTTLTKNLRDILDHPDVSVSKAQPGSSVHVPTAGSEDPDDKKGGPVPNQNPGAESSAGAQVTSATNEGVGASNPDWANKVPKYREKTKKKKLAKAMELSLIEKSQSGIMVCLYVPGPVGDQLALPGGEPIEDLHITLAYIPKVGADQVAFDAIVKCLRQQVGEAFAPISGCVGGIGIFNPSEGSDGKAVYYASYNSPVLPSVLGAVRGALDWGGIDYARAHGFVPHITLKYLEEGDPIRLNVATDQFRIPCISVASRALGRVDIELTGTRINKEEDELLAEVMKILDEPESEAMDIPIAKADLRKQIVYGVVLEPDSEDAQGDVMTAEDIEEAAHTYMEKARKVGRRHKDMIEKAFPVESYIAPVDMQFEGGPYGSSLVKKGSWVLAVKVRDNAEWAKVERGEYKAFSVGGFGTRV